MKMKFIYGLSVASLMLATACSQDDFAINGAKADGEPATVAMTIKVPQGIGSRSLGDGTTANKLYYAVYQENTDGTLKKIGDTETTDINIATTVTMNLITGYSYKVVYWAQNDFSSPFYQRGFPYVVDFANDGAKLSVEYDKIMLNYDEGDAFYACDAFTVRGDEQRDVDLYRPFAQVNIGTNDLAEANALATGPFSWVFLSFTSGDKVYDSMDLITGELSATYSNARFGFSQIDQLKNEQFPVQGYDYLSMCYILAPKDEAQLIDITFGADPGVGAIPSSEKKERTITNVPVQANYRTNIYGQVLTSNVELNVEIVPGFFQPDNNIDLNEDLMFAINNGGSVALSDDVNIPQGRLNITKNTTIDFNGHTVYSANEGNGNDDGAFLVTGDGKLVLKGDGGMQTRGNYASILVWADNGGTVTIEGGSYKATNAGEVIYIGQGGGTIYIKGGYFYATTDGSAILNCKDEAYRNGTAKFVVTGGTFEEFDPADSKGENPRGNFVAPGYKSVNVTIDGKNCYVVVPETSAMVNDPASVISAIDEGNDNIIFVPGTYTAEALGNPVNGVRFYDAGNQRFYTKITPDMTFNGEGVTFSGKISPNFHGATVKGFTFDKGKDEQAIMGSFVGHFIDCSFTGGVYAENGNNVGTFDNCYFYNEGDSSTDKMAFHNGNVAAGTVMTLNNCEIDGRCDFGVNGTLIFNNCTLNVRGDEWGVYGTGEVQFNNCTISDKSKIVAKQGATIKGL